MDASRNLKRQTYICIAILMHMNFIQVSRKSDKILAIHLMEDHFARGGLSELMDRRGCAILALEMAPKNLIFA